ncbi:MAG: DUF2723 domain-containing protein [Candidatus Aminicenantes bacterium]|nr:DUF2723 domain-containing protein [Candidatus Aminicenantes bacterium]
MKKITWPNVFSSWWMPLVFIGIALLYFSFLPVNYSFDGTVFSHFLRYALVRHDWLAVTQIHHLLYFPANYLLYRVLEAVLHYRVLEFFHLQLFSMFFGVLTLVLVERMLGKINLTPVLRLVGVASVAFSYSFWLYALDAEVHMAGVFFAVFGLYLLIFRRTGAGTMVWAALCFALAAGFHLANILITATVFLFLLEKRQPWRRYAQFFLAYLSFLLMLYGVYAAISLKPIHRILYNVFFGPDIYSGYRTTYFKPLTWSTVVSSLAALKRALLANTGTWSVSLVAGVLFLLAMACKRSAAEITKTFKRTMLFWFIPFFLFYTFFDSGNIEFKIHALVPLLLIAVTSLGRLKPVAANTFGFFLAGGLLISNLFFGIMPLADLSRNTNYQVALAIQKATPVQAQILMTGNFLGYGYGKIYLPYFAMRNVLILDWLLGRGQSLSEIHDRLQKSAASGQSLYALGEIAEKSESIKNLLDFHRVSENDCSRFYSGMRFILAAELPGGYRLYRMEFASP